MADEQGDLAEGMLAASRALVGIAIRGLDAVASDVTLAQHRVLLLVSEHDGLSVNGVAALLGVNQSNASRHTARLVELGLVSREEAQHDARAVVLRLTAAGRECVDAVRNARLHEIRRVLARMDLPEARQAAAALRAFAEATGMSVLHDGAALVD